MSYYKPLQKDLGIRESHVAQGIVEFGVRELWRKLPKWQERFLVNHYMAWFQAVSSLNQIMARENKPQWE